jgi:hypothetical protein
MRPSKLLRGAALYLDTHGWTKGQFFELLADTDGTFLPACASGAIMAAATGRCVTTGTAQRDDDPDAVAAMRALRVLADYLDGGYTPVEGYQVSAIDIIGDWNDDAGRTLTEVIETLQDAANGWETTHPTGGAQ